MPSKRYIYQVLYSVFDSKNGDMLEEENYIDITARNESGVHEILQTMMIQKYWNRYIGIWIHECNEIIEICPRKN